ncbi:hypothetical protein BGW36DRAFT_428338 [Talaromyces proteolyticus]|uniref:Uncharacterized protein n=1 Tax=Talaromyces proteolyticus TaxID=1131652 RepID=A0AAD4KPE4_9EURO|nr:uncharacterized protein BGW36DRAFT_428338 [Talaromyces proteolyticus]KAH8696325.1 hypothetical protein BGW36DRAFT_428338 [Talaromyces proteolyticus]
MSHAENIFETSGRMSVIDIDGNDYIKAVKHEAHISGTGILGVLSQGYVLPPDKVYDDITDFVLTGSLASQYQDGNRLPAYHLRQGDWSRSTAQRPTSMSG